MSGLLYGRCVLVTGAASGIGFATARLAAREGARVALCDRDEEQGTRAAAAIVAGGGDALFFRMDVTSDADVSAAVDAGVRAFGRLDGAFNNAGISTEPSGQSVKAADIALDAWQRVLAVNLTGVWQCMRHEIRHMLEAGPGGSIVNNASIAGLVGLPGQAAYTASKHGVVGLTRSAAAEYVGQGLRINAICPGFVETPLVAPVFERAGPKILAGVPVRRLGTPDEIADAVVWLLSDRSTFVAGAAIAADGGYTAT